MAAALFVFLVSIGLATFVETVHDTQTAKIMVYNANWFMVLLAYLSIGMISNIITYRMFQREKIAMLTFHVAFIIMVIGAAVTRFFGSEGMMIIREGQKVGYMWSAEPHLIINMSNSAGGSQPTMVTPPLYMSEAVDNSFSFDMDFVPNKGAAHKGINFTYVDFRKNIEERLITNDSIKETAIGIATTSTEPEYITEGEFIQSGDLVISYEKDDALPGVHIWKEGTRFKMKSAAPFNSLPMTALRQIRQSGGEVPDSMYTKIPMDSVITLQQATLYNVQGSQFVFSDVKKHTKKVWVKAKGKDAGTDMLIVKVTDKNASKIVQITGGMGRLPDQTRFELNGILYELGYGSRQVELPFEVICRDFQLDRYPGSNAPSSFASELTIIDTLDDSSRDKRLFMNHVIDFKGYRLFQSGYDPDEQGTRLSVNQDWWGTNISYLGYLLMGLGMVLAMFGPVGRMRELSRKLSKKKTTNAAKGSTLALALLLSINGFAQDTVDMHEDHSGHDHAAHAEHTPQNRNIPKQGKLYMMSEEHSEKLASLLVLDEKDGRFVPIHTLCDKILRKVSRSQTYKDYNAVQTVISMHMYPSYWQHEKIVHVSSRGGLREKLGVKDKASMLDLTDMKTGEFKLKDLYEAAHRMKESERGEEAKQVIKLQERYEVMLRVFSRDWTFLKILPVAGDNTNDWVPIMHHEIDSKEFQACVDYFGSLNAACMGKESFSVADKNLEKLKKLQRIRGGDQLPTESRVEMEISYNKMNIFKNSQYLYLLFGFILMIFFFVKTISKLEIQSKVFRILENIVVGILVVTFIYHGAGILMRALISGHEPWSTGYEALVFITWGMVGVGVATIRLNKVVLAGAAMFAFFLLFVSEMNLLDPEITNLQPVLKSYWLMIHVAIITTSYAPLGLACILGLVNLILYVVRSRSEGKHITLAIVDITYIAEILMTVGVIMLTIGTFLGGIWANESWGRYWGWDPKETWALVAILAYAVVLHLRLIPGVKDKFTFNAVSFWAYSTILFTFFGVNFYLVGLHSYANGEGLGEFPYWLIILGVILYAFTEVAAYRNQVYLSKGEQIPLTFFRKKLTILSVMIVVIALMTWLFRISDFGTIATNAGIILGLLYVATGIQFALGRLAKEPKKVEL